MRFGYKLTTVALFEVKGFMKKTSDSLLDANFGGSKKLKNFLFFFPKNIFRFDPNVFNDSKEVLNDGFGSEKLFIIKQKDFTLTDTNEIKDKGFLCTTAVG